MFPYTKAVAISKLIDFKKDSVAWKGTNFVKTATEYFVLQDVIETNILLWM